MNPAIGQRYIGPDVKGNPISGIILHVGQYGRGSLPKSYIVQTDPGENGRPGLTEAPADVVQQHLEGLALIRSMERDSE